MRQLAPPLTLYRPQPEWWARPHAAGGIHGLGHCMRVLVWADYAAGQLAAAGQPVDRTVVRWAAACHDCRRHDDGPDRGHGLRAAAWFGEHAATLDPTLSADQVQAVQHAITWHVPPDAVCPAFTAELACLKDADGLDRVRLGDFDAGYLRLPYLQDRAEDAARLLWATVGQADPWAALLVQAARCGLLEGA